LIETPFEEELPEKLMSPFEALTEPVKPWGTTLVTKFFDISKDIDPLSEPVEHWVPKGVLQHAVSDPVCEPE
jgi:hypothetical protein